MESRWIGGKLEKPRELERSAEVDFNELGGVERMVVKRP